MLQDIIINGSNPNKTKQKARVTIYVDTFGLINITHFPMDQMKLYLYTYLLCTLNEHESLSSDEDNRANENMDISVSLEQTQC